MGPGTDRQQAPGSQQVAVPPAGPAPVLPGYPPAPPTNTFAIVALATAFMLPVLGIVFGHAALSQLRRSGEQGRGLAIAGLAIGYSLTGLVVLFLLVYVVLAGLLFVVWALVLAAAGGAFS